MCASHFELFDASGGGHGRIQQFRLQGIGEKGLQRLQDVVRFSGLVRPAFDDLHDVAATEGVIGQMADIPTQPVKLAPISSGGNGRERLEFWRLDIAGNQRAK